jgi:hypothetical protein
MAKICGTCKFCVNVDAENAHCRRYPPRVVDGSGASAYAVVKAKTWWCGEWRRHWRRWATSFVR